MKSAIITVALLVLLAMPLAVYAQTEAVPVPPTREHKMGDVILEEGKKVTAEEPSAKATPPQTPAKAEPATAAPAAPAPAKADALIPEKEAPMADPVAPVATPPVKTVAPVEPIAPAPAKAPIPAEPEADTLKASASKERPMEMQVPAAKPAPTNLGEVELVERMVVARESYKLDLEALKQHYINAGNATKLQWVEDELTAFNTMDKHEYLSEMRLAGPDLRPTASIAAADQLYKEGLEFKGYPALFDKKEKLKTAVQKFRTIIRDYPTSDKIDDAAFRLGEIYEGFYFQDPELAALCYERCFQWNPKTVYPCRFNAAKLYDQKLMQRDKAVELYKLVVLEDTDNGHVMEATRRLTELGAKR